mgnify:CR=1 FL=1
MNYADITDEIAKIEDCKDALELQTLLKKFYPDIQDDSQIKVYHF